VAGCTLVLVGLLLGAIGTGFGLDALIRVSA